MPSTGWLRQALQQACKEVQQSPSWLKAIYAMNEKIARVRACQLENHKPVCRCYTEDGEE